MMKRIILFAILCIATFSAFAQSNPPVPYGDFLTWAKQASIPGYSLMECKKDGSHYVAGFASGTATLLQIKVSNINTFKSNTSGVPNPISYIWNGNQAVYSGNNQRSVFVVAVTDTKVCFTFTSNATISKTAMESLVSRTNLKSLTSAGVVSDVVWPESIPADLKINCVKTIFALGADGGYKEVYEVKAFMNADLIESVEAILRKFKGGTLSGVTSGQVTFSCPGVEDMPQLKAFYQEAEIVTFVYSVK